MIEGSHERENTFVNLYPLTPTQLQVAYHSIAHPDRPEVYAVQHTIRFVQKIDIRLMKAVLSTFWQQCVILRGQVIKDENAQIWFHINPHASLVFKVIDLGNVDLTSVQALIDLDRLQGFGCLDEVLSRFAVITTHQYTYFTWTFHHVLMGADSMRIMRDILLAYQAGLSGTVVQPRYTLSYADCLAQYYKATADDGATYWSHLLEAYNAKITFMELF